jgi:exo-beta-1,3-glucanase (GH17 family)
VYSGVWPCNTPATAPQITLSNHKTLKALYSGKQVVLTEFGWAAAATGTSIKVQANVITGQQCGVANDANQKALVQAMIDLYRTEGLPCNTFEAYREPWKGTSDEDVNRYWGICLGTSPYTCINAPQ